MTRYLGRLYYFISRKQPASNEMLQEYHQNKKLINQPIDLEGNNDSCVLLIHGWSSTSYEMHHLSQKLNSEGFSVCVPLLPGHGTKSSDLENIIWEDWYNCVEKKYLELKKKHKKVYVGGCSLGGNLSILLAQKYECVSGVVLLGTPFRMQREKMNFVIAKFVSQFKKNIKKSYPLKMKKICGIIRLISYQEYPIKSALEVLKAVQASRNNLKSVNQPILIFQSDIDYLLDRDSIYEFYKAINSSNKKMKLVPNAYHNFVYDKKHSDVYDEITKFVKSY